MAKLNYYHFYVGLTGVGFSILSSFLGPLILKKYVNNTIEERYKKKLNIEIKGMVYYTFLYSYFKYFNPGITIGLAYFLRSKKLLLKNNCLREINYKLETATKKEIFVSCFCFIIIAISILFIAIWYIIEKFF